MNVIDDLPTIQLLAYRIFESKEMENETAGAGIDVTIDSAGIYVTIDSAGTTH